MFGNLLPGMRLIHLTAHLLLTNTKAPMKKEAQGPRAARKMNNKEKLPYGMRKENCDRALSEIIGETSFPPTVRKLLFMQLTSNGS